MKASRIGIPVCTALAALAIATGCSSNDAADKAGDLTSAAAASATGSAATESTTQQAESEDSSESATATEADGQNGDEATTSASNPPNGVADTDCGPVQNPDGDAVTIIAISTPNGRAGCTEAINVGTEWVGSVSTSDSSQVQGWDCHGTPSDGTYISRCEKDGMEIGFRK